MLTPAIELYGTVSHIWATPLFVRLLFDFIKRCIHIGKSFPIDIYKRNSRLCIVGTYPNIDTQVMAVEYREGKSLLPSRTKSNNDILNGAEKCMYHWVKLMLTSTREYTHRESPVLLLLLLAQESKKGGGGDGRTREKRDIIRLQKRREMAKRCRVSSR